MAMRSMFLPDSVLPRGFGPGEAQNPPGLVKHGVPPPGLVKHGGPLDLVKHGTPWAWWSTGAPLGLVKHGGSPPGLVRHGVPPKVAVELPAGNVPCKVGHCSLGWHMPLTKGL